MKKLVLAVIVTALYSVPAAAQGADTLKMKLEVKDGRHQMRGVFGSNWAVGEIQTEAAKNCGEVGKPLAHFKVLGANSKGLKVFEAACR
jgi:hypothetical protein